MRRAIENALWRSWQRRGVLSTALLPLAALYGALSARRLRRHAQRAWHAPVPVIVIGNLIAGGTGKTPLAAAVGQALQAAGWHPGYVSRGYGARIGPSVHGSDTRTDAAWLGDEPALLHAETGLPVAVHPQRVRAAAHLLAGHPELDVLIADDGLQHRQLARDVEIIVQDARGTGNGRLLPAGPLRESATRLQQADWLVTQLDATQPLPAPAPMHDAAPVGPRRLFMQLQPEGVRHLHSGRWLDWDAWRQGPGAEPVDAVAGIGQPARFFTMLRHAGQPLRHTLEPGDHRALDAAQWQRLSPEVPVLLTAKDAVKYGPPHDPRLWLVQARAVFSDPTWIEPLQQALRAAQAHKPAHTH